MRASLISALGRVLILNCPGSVATGSNLRRRPLGQHLLHHFPSHVGQAKVPSLVSIGELFMVQPQAVQDGCVEVMDVNRVLDNLEAKIGHSCRLHAPP